MRKKILTLVLVLAVIFSFSSCDTAETGVVITQPVKVAVQSSSAEYLAAYDYAIAKGYELVEYESRQAAVIAVENGKADYVIVSSEEATDDFLSSVDLQLVGNTEYKIQYCAVFRKDNQVLKASFNQAISKLKQTGAFDEINSAYSAGENYEPENYSLENEKITVLCCPVFDNLLFMDEKGNLAGKELDFIGEICNELSLEAQISVVKEYDEMFVALEQGAGDIIISAVEYTPELEDDYLLSDVYNQTTFGVYKRK